MAWYEMMCCGITNDIYTTQQLTTLKNTGLDQLVTDGYISAEEKTTLIALIDTKLGV